MQVYANTPTSFVAALPVRVTAGFWQRVLAFGVDALNGPEMEQRLSDVALAEKWAASTFNHYRSLLMLVYREARRSGKVSANPARDIRHRKENNSRVRFLSRGDNAE